MVKEYNDIETYRKIRRKKRRRRHIVTLVIILVLLVCLFFTFAHFLNIDIFDSGSSQGELTSGAKPTKEGFPISLEGDKAVDVNSMGGLITLITDTKLAFYTDSGKWLGSDAHGYANPVARTTTKKTLVYDNGGYKFKVVTKNQVVGSKTLTNKIIFAEISDDGYVAVATQESRYYGCLTIYDDKLEELYKWYSSTYQLVGTDFYRNSSGCAVLGYTAENGGIVSAVVSLDFSSDKIVFEKKFPGVLGVSIAVKNSGNIAVVSDSKFNIIDSKGKDIGEYVYNKQLSFASNVAANYTVLALTNTNSRANSQAVALDDKGKVIGSYVVDKSIKDVISDGSRIILLGTEKIYNLDMSLKLINSIKCDSDAKKIAFIGSYMYVLGSEKIVKKTVE